MTQNEIIRMASCQQRNPKEYEDHVKRQRQWLNHDGSRKDGSVEYAAPQPVQSLSAQDLNDLEIETKWAGDSHEFERIVNAAVAKLKPVRTKDLTDDEIESIMVEQGDLRTITFARAVIAADREKNK